jgi:DNA-binding CsgD family transcriptional regulator
MVVGNSDELTARERDVLRLLTDGLSNRAIAAELSISSRTVEAHVRGLLRKLAVSSRSELISRWLRSGQDAQMASAGTLWLTEPERSHPWSRPLARLIRDREHDAAFAMMVEIVETQPSWEAGLDLLKLGEMLGRATDVLRHYVRLVDEMQSGPSSEVARAIAYYRGRLLSQVGLIRSALDVHTANLPAGGVLFGGPYQRRSRFAIAHLHFKVEDFAQAQRHFDGLHQGLSTVHEPDRRYVVDVYQFCATLALISVVHDLPHSSARAVPVDLDTARHFSTEALRLSLMENYPEGIVWAQAVQAFTAEASGEPERAELLWHITRRSALTLTAQWSVKVHVLLYEAGFERRRQQLDAASERINEAEQFLPVDPNLRLRARVLEEKALVLRDRGGDLRAVRNLFHEALNRYSLEPGLILLSDWPITTRLRRTCKDLRLDYGSYLLPGRATHEQPG